MPYSRSHACLPCDLLCAHIAALRSKKSVSIPPCGKCSVNLSRLRYRLLTAWHFCFPGLFTNAKCGCCSICREKYLTPRKTLDLLTLASYYIKMRQNRYKRNWRPFPQKIFNFKKCNILHLFCFPRLICFCFLIRCFFLIRINFRHCDFRHFFRFTRTQLPGTIAAENNNAITLFFIFPPFPARQPFIFL